MLPARAAVASAAVSGAADLAQAASAARLAARTTSFLRLIIGSPLGFSHMGQRRVSVLLCFAAMAAHENDPRRAVAFVTRLARAFDWRAGHWTSSHQGQPKTPRSLENY